MDWRVCVLDAAAAATEALLCRGSETASVEGWPGLTLFFEPFGRPAFFFAGDSEADREFTAVKDGLSAGLL
jgi:hypothetical protein